MGTSDTAAPPQTFPGNAWRLLQNADAMAAAVSQVTGRTSSEARRMLWGEFVRRGSTVRRAAKALGVTRYRFDDAMVRFYTTSDAFLFELPIWNLNLIKRSMRRWITRWTSRVLGPNQRVLTWGDGLGFDTLALSDAGHEVTYFELPGHTSTFARRMFDAASAPVLCMEREEDVPERRFDAVVCLDVLEHVPDVPETLAKIRACLRPGGVLFVHAPFYLVHPVSITHLRANRRYSGSLALFRRAGFSLHDAQPTWGPLVLVRNDGARPRRPWGAWPRLAVALPFGLVLAIGRLTVWPFEVLNLATRVMQPWFGDNMLVNRLRRFNP